MKKWVVILLSVFGSGAVRAQQDIQAMLKQIAKLEIYILDLGKGYQIAKEGLTTIGEVTNGEFSLHNLFFSSLKRVNPSVAKYSKVAEIVADQVSIVNSFKRLIQSMRAEGRLTKGEMNYVIRVYTNISDECTKYLNGLFDVLIDGRLEMTDDERIGRIDRLWVGMKDKYAFTKEFVYSAGRVVEGREDEAKEIELLKSLE